MTAEAWFHVVGYVSAQSRLTAEERQYWYTQQDNATVLYIRLLQVWCPQTVIVWSQNTHHRTMANQVRRSQTFRLYLRINIKGKSTRIVLALRSY
jgi:hypothetical protein